MSINRAYNRQNNALPQDDHILTLRIFEYVTWQEEIKVAMELRLLIS